MNPFNFRGAPMVTTFICSAGCHTQEVWKFLEKVSHTDVGMSQVVLEHPFLKNVIILWGMSLDLRSSLFL